MSTLTLTRQPASRPAADTTVLRGTARAVAFPALLAGLLLAVVGYLAATAAVVLTVLALLG